MRSVFVTGTDTGVGKTVVAAAILAAARSRGVDAAPMKPVQTGCVRCRSGLEAQDLTFCLRHANLAPTARMRARMAPYRFRLAASPHWAASEEGAVIRLPRMIGSFRRLAAVYEAVIVEGAGGVLVPLNGRATLRDLMAALGLPVLVVARPSLGTLNHTLLTLEALRSAGLTVAGVALNAASSGCDPAMARSNAAALRRFGRVQVAGPLTYRADLAGPRCTPERFRRATDAFAQECLAMIGDHPPA